jgi:membrane fusion protein (multidrug efflux system)
MKPEQKNRTKLKLYVPLALITLAILTGIFYWYRNYTTYITTDDAHVDADNVGIQSKILGRIAAIYSAEGDTVRKGRLLAFLDSSDYVAQRNQAYALREQAQANLSQAQYRYGYDEKNIKVQEINLERAVEDFNRAKAQSEGGVITAEQFEHARKAYESASAQLEAAKAQLMVSKSSIATAGSAVAAADAQIKILDTQLNNTRLYSPADGIIARRWLLPGDIVQPGQAIFTLTQNHNLWIAAFPEETKIGEIYNGQKVIFTIDAFPDVRFSGKVFMTGSSTASVFSLIPANNAAGNFTKVTQRIPIRISIDSADNKEAISSFNLLSGMSATVKIIRNNHD